MRALSPEERQRATIGTDLPSERADRRLQRQPAIDPRRASAMTSCRPRAASVSKRCSRLYTGRIRPGHAEIRWAEAKRHLGETRFAWIGAFDDASPFYYRIQSPVILVEFDHQSGIMYDNDKPSRDHIHTLVRTPNGNDYGKDLLRQHYAQHDHAHPVAAHRYGEP